MELTLNRVKLGGYAHELNTTVTQEEIQETIVPDQYPDIIRIADTGGTVCLRECVVGEGKAVFRGSVWVNVLYMPERTEKLCRMVVELPFTAATEQPGLTEGGKVFAEPLLGGLEVRTLNPRKILVRAEIKIGVSVYGQEEEGLSCTVEGEKSVQCQTEQMVYSGVAGVYEKTFQCEDVLQLPVGRPRAIELMKNELAITQTERKMIGGRLIFKGEVKLTTLYLSEEGTLEKEDFLLPFSQIIEVGGEEERRAMLSVFLSDYNVSLGEKENTLSVDLDLVAQAVILEKRKVSWLSDLYSTEGDVVLRRENITLSCMGSCIESRGVARELLETGIAVDKIHSFSVRILSVRQTREREKLQAVAETEVFVFYAGEDGVPYSATRRVTVQTQCDWVEEGEVFVAATPTADRTALASSGGIEVRFSILFRMTAVYNRTVPAIVECNLTASDTERKCPSVILRRARGGEGLWGIAKEHRTTVSALAAVNGIAEGERLSDGMLLLIPGKSTL